MSTTDERFRPFSSGSQFADWEDSNCWRCTKGHRVNSGPDDPEDIAYSACPINVALHEAYWDDGSIARDIAERMGYFQHNGPDPNRTDGIWSFSYCWKCPEVEWSEEWKREFCRKYPEKCGQLIMAIV